MHPFVQGALDLLAAERCAACDQDAPLAQGPFCGPCEVSTEAIDGPGAAYQYGGAVADAIRRFKYEGRSDLGRSLGRRLAEDIEAAELQIDAIVPVPLHWRRRRSRGYDQAALLCGPVSRTLAVPVLFRALRRLRNTPRQTELARAQRLTNVRGAFGARPLPALRILLVDDVKTTGATLEAASSVLSEAGAAEVHTWVLAARVLHATT